MFSKRYTLVTKGNAGWNNAFISRYKSTTETPTPTPPPPPQGKSGKYRVILGVLLASLSAAYFVIENSKKKKDEVNPEDEPKGQNFPKDAMLTKQLDLAPWQIPHDDKKWKGGEDTYFISKTGNQFGVFDGVGGWAKKGVDPREYSLALSRGCLSGVDEFSLAEPLSILKHGYEDAKGIRGSSTAVVVSIEGKRLCGINLGDSGYYVIRDNKILYESPSQQHKFNMPYQLGSNNHNVPEDGVVNCLNLKDKDTVVLMTDGVLDNMTKPEIVDTINKYSELRPQAIAKKVCLKAYFGSKLETGKPDDITTLVVKYKDIE